MREDAKQNPPGAAAPNPPNTSAQKISDLTLEQYHLGELRPAQARRVREALERDEELRGRLAAIVRSDGEIRARYPAERVVPLILERALRLETEERQASAERQASTERTAAERQEGRRPWRMPTLAWAIPLAAMVLALISVPFVPRLTDETRLKGVVPHLLVFRKTPTGAEELAQGALAKAGDVLQLSYVAADAKYGVIFSVDGRGTLTWHVPSGYAGGAVPAPALDPKGPVPLPNAYELDDAPGFERFFLVYSSQPFRVSDVEPVARAWAAKASGGAGALALPRGLGQSSLLVKKQG